MAGAEPTRGLSMRAAAGARAERMAADFLVSRGLAIVTRNFRTRHGEIDLIARDGATLVFV
jgi:putative endonuclease